MSEINNSLTNKWSETDASNTYPSPDGWPAGTYPNQVEPIGRATMGAIKRFWDRINGTVTTTGSPNAYVYTPLNTAYPTALVAGEKYCFIPNFTNTGPSTLNINSTGIYNILKQTTSGLAALTGKEIPLNQFTEVAFDGTQFQILNNLIVPTPPNPTGTVISFASSTAPSGYLECAGTAISRTTYANLFAVIGTTFGTGDGSTTFNIPDLRGQFIRGWSDTGSVDSGRSFGSSQTDSFGSHTHTINDPTHIHYPPATGSGPQYAIQVSPGTGGEGLATSGSQNFSTVAATAAAATNITINNTGGSENRPLNIALMYCIKT